jgi:hypothetical protein
MGISLHEQPGMDSSTGNLERWVKQTLGVECLSLYGSSVKGTWKEDSLAGALKDR